MLCVQARRKWILSELVASKALESASHVIFIESICTDEHIIESNIRATKVSMPDYKGMDQTEASDDFKARIEHYKLVCVRWVPLHHQP